jgi:hypothetical protein
MPSGFGMEVREYFAPIFQLESPCGRPALAGSHQAAFESAFARLKKDLEAENSTKSSA